MTKGEILKAIRQNCLDCMCDQANEVKLCPITKCALFPFRFGKDPRPRELSPEEKARRAELLRTTVKKRQESQNGGV